MRMIPTELGTILESDPEKVHGAICFRGTRVPVEILLDYGEEGTGLEEFLDDYPGVPKESAETVLRYLARHNRQLLDLAS